MYIEQVDVTITVGQLTYYIDLESNREPLL